AKHADWIKQQSASGREPTAKEIARKRAEFEGERRLVAEKRAQAAREYAKLQADASAHGRTGRLNGSGGEDTIDRWTEDALRREAREWLQNANGAWHFGTVSETLFRFMSEQSRAWLETEKATGREPGAADIAARRAAIVAKFNEVKSSCAEIQADVAEKKQRSIEAGGLYVLGTERHESRRIDNQLRGRSGRQGDPGRSKFYLSLEDDLMRIFGSDRMDGMLQKLGLQEGEAIIHPWINKAIEKAQQKVEARNFDIRKNILKYDNVMNDQRKVVFEQRKDFMAQESVRETIDEMRHGVIDDIVTRHIPPDAYPEQWDIAGLKDAVANFLNLELAVAEWAKEEGIADEEMRERLRKAADDSYAERVEKNSAEVMNYVEKQVLLQSLDHLWREHLVTLDHLRQVIGWRGYAQRDPLNEYKSEAFDLFNELVGHLRQNVTGQLMRIEVVFQPPEPEGLPPMFAQHLDPATGENELGYGQGSGSFGGGGPALGFAAAEMSGDTAVLERDPNDPASWGKVGRNEACPCQSGKKYKHCHGRFG
ncbi:MAG: SEC-C metal-binding domain-containing protein, partial [Microvirga sp.]